MKGNNKMKKKIVKVLCVVMATMCVTGCEDKSSKNENKTTATTPVETSAKMGNDDEIADDEPGDPSEEMFEWSSWEGEENTIKGLADGYEDTEVIVIPKRCESVGSGAFFMNNKITEVRFENDNTKIEKIAFAQCENLKKIQLPNNLETISESAFSGCKSLEEIEIPDSVTLIDYRAFFQCDSLKKIKLGAGVKEIEEGAFMFCMQLDNVELPEGLEIIHWDAFKDCNLTEIKIPKSVTDFDRDCIDDDVVVYLKHGCSLEEDFGDEENSKLRFYE